MLPVSKLMINRQTDVHQGVLVDRRNMVFLPVLPPVSLGKFLLSPLLAPSSTLVQKHEAQHIHISFSTRASGSSELLCRVVCVSFFSSIPRHASRIRLTLLSTESRAAFVIVTTSTEVGPSLTVSTQVPLGCVGRLVSTQWIWAPFRDNKHGTGCLGDLNGEAGFECSFCFERGTFVTVKQRFLQTFN